MRYVVIFHFFAKPIQYFLLLELFSQLLLAECFELVDVGEILFRLRRTGQGLFWSGTRLVRYFLVRDFLVRDSSGQGLFWSGTRLVRDFSGQGLAKN